jgi:hypothetical protein
LYIDYKFAGTPLRLRVGADLWNLSPAGLVGRRDPRAALFGEFGDVDVLAAVVLRRSATRLGYENNSNFLYYTFSAGYNLRPHRFQFDVAYFRDRFTGAQMQTVGLSTDGDKFGWGPGRRRIVCCSCPVGRARWGRCGAWCRATWCSGPSGAGRWGSPPWLVARCLRRGASMTFLLAGWWPMPKRTWGSADGDPTDRKLHGFAPSPNRVSARFTGVPTFAHFETSGAIGARDLTCPARLQGLANRQTTSLNIGTGVMGTTAGVECWHDFVEPFNDRAGNLSHLGLATTYSNVGTLLIPVGLKVFPLKGHELKGWYAYRGMVTPAWWKSPLPRNWRRRARAALARASTTK